jgi:hypothetical protein
MARLLPGRSRNSSSAPGLDRLRRIGERLAPRRHVLRVERQRPRTPALVVHDRIDGVSGGGRRLAIDLIVT